MPNNIHLDPIAVAAETARLRGILQTELGDARSQYLNLLPQIDQLDSATNARLRDTVWLNLRKKEVVVETLDKLLSFISNSTTQIEAMDNTISGRLRRFFARFGRGGRN